jgi:hypothetical protein
VDRIQIAQGDNMVSTVTRAVRLVDQLNWEITNAQGAWQRITDRGSAIDYSCDLDQLFRGALALVLYSPQRFKGSVKPNQSPNPYVNICRQPDQFSKLSLVVDVDAPM